MENATEGHKVHENKEKREIISDTGGGTNERREIGECLSVKEVGSEETLMMRAGFRHANGGWRTQRADGRKVGTHLLFGHREHDF